MKNIRVLYEERASKGCNVDILTIRLEEVLSSTLEEIKESIGSVYDVYATKAYMYRLTRTMTMFHASLSLKK